MKSAEKRQAFLNEFGQTGDRIDRHNLYYPRSRLIATTRLNPRLSIPSDHHATIHIYTAFQRLSRPYNRPIEIHDAIQERL